MPTLVNSVLITGGEQVHSNCVPIEQYNNLQFIIISVVIVLLIFIFLYFKKYKDYDGIEIKYKNCIHDNNNLINFIKEKGLLIEFNSNVPSSEKCAFEKGLKKR